MASRNKKKNTSYITTKGFNNDKEDDNKFSIEDGWEVDENDNETNVIITGTTSSGSETVDAKSIQFDDNATNIRFYVSSCSADMEPTYYKDDKGNMFILNTVNLLLRADHLELTKEEYQVAKFQQKVEDLEYNIVNIKKAVPKNEITKKPGVRQDPGFLRKSCHWAGDRHNLCWVKDNITKERSPRRHKTVLTGRDYVWD